MKYREPLTFPKFLGRWLLYTILSFIVALVVSYFVGAEWATKAISTVLKLLK